MLSLQPRHFVLPPSAAEVPRGASTSPHLFNFLVSTYLNSCKLVSSYADDVHVSVSLVYYQTTTTSPVKHAEDVDNWAEERQLQISAQKFHITLLTSDTHQFHQHPKIRLRNTPLPLEL